MYASKQYDPESIAFDDDIAELDAGRDVVLKIKNLAIFDNDNALICKAGPTENAEFSCNTICIAAKTPDEVVILEDEEQLKINIATEKIGITTIHWEDIDEAIEQDKKLRKIRNALKMNDEDTLKEEIAGKIISDNWADPEAIVKSTSKIRIEDLSLYRNCILVRDRIWVPEDLRQSFYNNLHLGHRGVNIMMRLALRSSYWVNMKADLQYFYNDCSTCNHYKIEIIKWL